ncbi:hypothetical protein [Paenibacillus sp. J22TS3]|nr:hypothetical protein [Paenibacillus sp. J22TS3]
MLTDAIGEEDGELEEDLAPVIDPPREITYADRQATHFLPVS